MKIKKLLQEDLLTEAKADTDKLIAHVGEDEANRFLKLKDRLKGAEKDLYYWIKKEPEELTKTLDALEATPTRSQKDKEAGKGAELVAENDYYKVYKINTFEASKKYGANTKWCITGKESGWIKDENENKYWKQYTDRGIEFYFFISKDNKHKYALVSHPDKRDNYDIFDETDKSITTIPNAPEIEEIYIPEKEINGMIIRGTTVVEVDYEAKTITIPEGIMSIEDRASSYRTGLTSVTIPDSVTSIGEGAFYNCSSLTSITYQGTKAQWNAISKGLDWNDYTGDYKIYCTDGTIPKQSNESLQENAITEVYPNKGESKEDFISRFMSVTKDEYPDRKQRYAVALSYWDRKDEALKEDMEEVEVKQTEPTEEDRVRGLASVLHDLIQQQWSIIDQYNSAVATFDFEGFDEYTEPLKDLVADETANVGVLEGLLIQLDPTYEEIYVGKEKIDKEFV